jgi:hypothetical protein
MKVVLLLLYIWLLPNGQAEVKFEQKVFKTVEECQIEGGKKARAIGEDPRFIEGLYAGCVKVPMEEAKK